MGCCCSSEQALLSKEKLKLHEVSLIVNAPGTVEEKLKQCLHILSAQGSDALVAATTLEQLATICGSHANRAPAVKLGALPATLKAMKEHALNSELQHWGCAVVCMAAKGVDTKGFERKELAADEGAIETVIAALRANQQDDRLVIIGCAALANIVVGDDAMSLQRAEQAAELGAIELTVALLKAHASSHGLQYYGRSLLSRLCRVTSGRDPDAKAALARNSGAKEEWLDEQPPVDTRMRPLMDPWQCSIRVSG